MGRAPASDLHCGCAHATPVQHSSHADAVVTEFLSATAFLLRRLELARFPHRGRASPRGPCVSTKLTPLAYSGQLTRTTRPCPGGTPVPVGGRRAAQEVRDLASSPAATILRGSWARRCRPAALDQHANPGRVRRSGRRQNRPGIPSSTTSCRWVVGRTFAWLHWPNDCSPATTAAPRSRGAAPRLPQEAPALIFTDRPLAFHQPQAVGCL
jgi:hypothetical protein